MRIKIATALVCLVLCILTNTTGTTFAHSHQKVISDVTNNNEMMIEEDSQKLRHAKIMEWRDDIPWEDCTWEKIFGDKK